LHSNETHKECLYIQTYTKAGYSSHANYDNLRGFHAGPVSNLDHRWGDYLTSSLHNTKTPNEEAAIFIAIYHFGHCMVACGM
jgi:hypothetical protein